MGKQVLRVWEAGTVSGSAICLEAREETATSKCALQKSAGGVGGGRSGRDWGAGVPRGHIAGDCV